MPIVGGLAYAAAEGIGVATETAVGLAVAAEGVTWLPVAYGAYKVATGDYSAHDKSVSLSDAATIKSEGISNNMPDNLRGAKRQRVHLSERIHIGHVSDAPELGHKVVGPDHQHVLPNNVDYSQSPEFPLNQEHAQRIENHKRKEREDKKTPVAKRGRLFGSDNGDDGGGDEPEDPLIQAMMIGPNLNSYLNSHGCERNWAWVECETIVRSSALKGQLFHKLPLSLGSVRYNHPFNIYAGMYYGFRARLFEFRFCPIQRETTYVVGASQTVHNETVLEVAEGAITGTQTQPVTTSQELDELAFELDVENGGVPQAGPVAVAIIPGGINLKVDGPLGPLYHEDRCVQDLIRTGYCKVTDPINGKFPAMHCKYTVPVDQDDDISQFIDPFPREKYREEVIPGTTNIAEKEARHDATWRQYGCLYMCADTCQRDVDVYMVKTRILVEFRGVRDVYLDPEYASSTDREPRRLVTDFRSPSTAAIEGSQTLSVVESNPSSDPTTDMSAVVTNATNITLHDQRIQALELLGGKLKSHQGETAFTTHNAGSGLTTSLDYRIASQDTTSATLSGRIDATEADISLLQGDVNTNMNHLNVLNAGQTTLSGRVDATEADITLLQGDVTTNTTALTSKLSMAGTELHLPSAAQIIVNNVTGTPPFAVVNPIEYCLSRGCITQGNMALYVGTLLVPYDTRITAVEDRSCSSWTPSWTSLSLTSPLTNVGGGWVTAQCTRIQYGTAYLVKARGFIQDSPADVLNSTSNFLICTLPAGYRPSYQHSFAVHGLYANETVRVDVGTDGSVTLIGHSSSGQGFLNLNAIEFLTN